MAIGVWEPPSKSQAAPLDLQRLRAYVRIYRAAEPQNLAAALSAEQRAEDSRLMKLEASHWQVADGLDDSELVSLVEFFTLAEMQLPGWDAGKQSPVIYLVRILKQRQAFTPALRQWIKANSDNRYLPNGAVL